MIHPVSSLPPELLHLIFHYVQGSTPYTRRINLLPEITFSQVSKSWRHHALSNATLWKSIIVDSPQSPSLLKLYLRRSGDCLLTINLDIYCLDKSASSPQQIASFLDDVMEAITPHIHRIQSLSVGTRYGATMEHILAFLEGKTADNLKSLALDAHMGLAEIDGDDTPPLKPFPFHVPVLRKFKMANLAREWPSITQLDTLQLLFPGSNIHSILISTPVLHSVCTSAQMLTVLTIDVSAIHDVGLNTIEMPSLRCLRVIGTGDHDHRLLWAFDAPSLEALWLELGLSFLPQPIAPASEKPKFPSVRYLTVQTTELPKRIQIARHFPNVTHIHFSFCWDIKKALDSLLDHTYDDDPFAFMEGRKTLQYPSLTTVALRSVHDRYSKAAEALYNTSLAFSSASNERLRFLTCKDAYEKLLTKLKPGWRSVCDLDILTEENYRDPWWKIVNDEWREKVFR
ncbi:hypothetical protein ONZ45_g2709 [Pleurotus djamor]|nr:hypothetical protein ONZ45_g2709 [Pleurotus djamor]